MARRSIEQVSRFNWRLGGAGGPSALDLHARFRGRLHDGLHQLPTRPKFGDHSTHISAALTERGQSGRQFGQAAHKLNAVNQAASRVICRRNDPRGAQPLSAASAHFRKIGVGSGRIGYDDRPRRVPILGAKEACQIAAPPSAHGEP